MNSQNTLLEVPSHIAFIMDGNGRWAERQGLRRIEGHRAGAKTVRMVVKAARKRGIRYLTLFAFSTENWRRPAAEVGALMQLFERYLRSELTELCHNGVRLRVIGERERLPKGVQRSLEISEQETIANNGLDLILAVSYGGRAEITTAAKKLAQAVAVGEITVNQIDEAALAARLYAPEVPDPDLLIRTSGEQRISNFLLWQLAYTELISSPLLWPEFSEQEFDRCLTEYSQRQRRYGSSTDLVGVNGVEAN